VRPGDLVWVDVSIPAGDRLWDDDVNRAFQWLGRAWVGALADVGVAASVHQDGLPCTPWSRRVCFGSVGPGEVTIEDGRKVVGLAQRRTRAGALFQCAALLRWDPEEMVRLLDLDADAAAELAKLAAPVTVEGSALQSAFLRALDALAG